MVDLRGNTVTSSSFTARIESIPSSYGPSMPELPPRREIPTERIRSRSIVTGWVLIVPALVITKPSNGICFHHLAQSTGEGGQTEIENGEGRTKTSSHPPSSRAKYSRCCHRSSFVGPSVCMLTKYEPRVRGCPAARTRSARKRWFDTSSVSSPNSVGRNYSTFFFFSRCVDKIKWFRETRRDETGEPTLLRKPA